MAWFTPYSEESSEAAAEVLLDQLKSYGWHNIFPAVNRLQKSLRRMPTIIEIKEAMGLSFYSSYEDWYADEIRRLVMRILKECGAIRPWQE